MCRPLSVEDVLREAISLAGKDPVYQDKPFNPNIFIMPVPGAKPLRLRALDIHINVARSRMVSHCVTGELIFSGYWVDDEIYRSDVVLSSFISGDDKSSYMEMGTLMTTLSYYIWETIFEHRLLYI